jgi:replicative DNA helicase
MLEDLKIPPNNFEAEESVLGCVLIDNESIFDVAYFLKPEFFYREINNKIFSHMLEMSRERRPIDLITLCDELRDAGWLEEVGGEAYIIGLINTVPTSVNVMHYAKIIEEKAVRRQLITAASKTASLAFDETVDIEEVMTESEAAIFDVATGEDPHKGTEISDVARRHMTMMDKISEGDYNPGIPTGYIDLDRCLRAGGFERGQLVLVPGDTGMGKSSLLLCMATSMAKKDFSVVFFTLEMTGEQLFQRQISQETRIPSKHYYNNQLDEGQWSNYYEKIGILSDLPMHIDDAAKISPMSMLSKCRRIQARMGLDIVFVDYLALMDADGKHNTETLRLDSISRNLKMIAKALDVVVVCAAQLTSKQIANRMDKRPTLTDLRNSTDPNNHSDIVIFVYRDDYYNPETSERPNIAEVNMAKQRDGIEAIIDLYWQREYAMFKNLERLEIFLPDSTATHADHVSKKFDL